MIAARSAIPNAISTNPDSMPFHPDCIYGLRPESWHRSISRTFPTPLYCRTQLLSSPPTQHKASHCFHFLCFHFLSIPKSGSWQQKSEPCSAIAVLRRIRYSRYKIFRCSLQAAAPPPSPPSPPSPPTGTFLSGPCFNPRLLILLFHSLPPSLLRLAPPC